MYLIRFEDWMLCWIVISDASYFLILIKLLLIIVQKLAQINLYPQLNSHIHGVLGFWGIDISDKLPTL